MNKLIAFLMIAVTGLSACSKDDPPMADNVAQFEAKEQGLESDKKSITIRVRLTRTTDVAIPISLTVAESGVVYSTQYTISPAVSNATISLTVPPGSSEAAFTLTKAENVLLDGDESIAFTIKSAGSPVLIGSTNILTLKFSSIVSAGSTMELQGGTGGAAAVNSVFVDFSNNAQFPVARDSWDLGFYAGTGNRVILNNTNGASVIVVNKTDINQVSSADFDINDLAIGFGVGSLNAMDNVEGDLTKTAIAEIAANDADNKVYILSRKGGAGTAPAATDLKKIRILRTANGYTLQYADVNAASFQTVTVNKDAAFNFQYVSLNNGALVDVEPEKGRWDIQWTWSLYQAIDFGGSGALVPYAFSDLVFSNQQGGAQVAEVLTSTTTYENFGENNIAGVTFSNKRDVIGSKWRVTQGTIGVKTDRFYVVKDPTGNVYKLKFVNFHAADGGTRGKPNIAYQLVKKA